MATIDSLPNETLCKIMSMLKESLPKWNFGPPSNSRRHYDALLAASLVCTRWRDPAQRALFDEAYLPLQLARADALLASPARARYRTRTLWGWCWAQDMAPSGPAWPLAVNCHGLQSLTLYGNIAGSWDQLASSSFADLKSLSIVIASPQARVIKSSPLPMRLSSLRIRASGRQSESTLITALFTASSQSLERLRLAIYDVESEIPFIPVLRLVAPRLRTLILDTRHNIFEGDLGVFSSFECLEYLAFPAVFFHGEGINPAHLGAILNALPSPPTLRHLHLRLDSVASIASFPPLLENSALSNLYGLVVSIPHDARLSVPWSKLKQACKGRGIMLASIKEG